MADRIKIRRGLNADIPTLSDYEIGYTTDTEELVVGTPTGNVVISSGDVDSVNGKIGVVVLITDDIAEGSSFYYSDDLVQASPAVSQLLTEADGYATTVALSALDAREAAETGNQAAWNSTVLTELDGYGATITDLDAREAAETLHQSTWNTTVLTELDGYGFGDVTAVGTPLNNQIGVWTSANTLEGDANVTWDGSQLLISGDITTESVDISSAIPVLKFYENTAALDEKRWVNQYAFSGTHRQFIVNDANTVVNVWFEVIRTAMVIDSIAFKTDSGTDALFIDSSQKIGIGTILPKNRLDISGAAAIGAGYAGVRTATANGLIVEGNVGIGVIAPVQKLEVLGNAVISGTVTSNGIVLDSSITALDAREAAETGNQAAWNSTVLTELDGYATSSGAGVSGYLAFFNGTDGITGEAALTWDVTNDILDAYGNIQTHGQTFSVLPADLVPSSTAQEISWDDGNSATIDLASATGDVTVTLINGKAGASYIIKIVQSAATARDIIWPGNVLWPGGITPTITTSVSSIDIVSVFYDGTSYYCNIGQDFS